MKRTLLFSENFPPVTGGASRRFWEIYRRQAPDAVRVLTGHHAAARDRGSIRVDRLSRSSTEREFGGPIPVSPFGSALRRVRELVRSEGITRIHCGRALPEGWIALATRLLDGVPYDCFVHGEEANRVSNGAAAGFLLSRRYRMMNRAVYAGAARLICSSESTAAIVREQWSIEPDRVRVLLPGVDTRWFAPPHVSRARPASWEGRRVVLSAGRLERRKGQDMLLRAIDTVRRDIPDLLIAIVGDGVEAGRLRDLAAALRVEPFVEFHPEVDEETLRSYYQHCDLFVLANRQVGYDIEGFGMVLLEAQACGVPVIAGCSGGAPEALIAGGGPDAPVAGETGLVVDCSSVEPLAAALVSLLSDPVRRAAMGHAARELMVRRFDWDTIVAAGDWIFDA